MDTRIAARFHESAGIDEAEAILRACVHCGFCTATCPTYQLLGDELDGPRGRIYLIKQLLEGQPAGTVTRDHLDRCLSCRSCETTCPSGVRYGRLLDIAREIVDVEVPRPWYQALPRRLLRSIVPFPRRFAMVLRLARLLRPLLPASTREKLPRSRPPTKRLTLNAQPTRRMLVLDGCVQAVTTPDTNAIARRILGRLGIGLVSVAGAGCCGAVSHHLGAAAEARDFIRANIDAWWPEVEQGAEAIVVTASGCGVMVKDYGELLKDDPLYAGRAQRISELARDFAEVVAVEDLSLLRPDHGVGRVAFHSPCTLQHGQKLPGLVESILTRLGFTLVAVRDAHLCCGSAGTYSILQPQLSRELRDLKLDALEREQPNLIVTANIGCQLHLAGAAGVPVKHWLELLDARG